MAYFGKSATCIYKPLASYTYLYNVYTVLARVLILSNERRKLPPDYQRMWYFVRVALRVHQIRIVPRRL